MGASELWLRFDLDSAQDGTRTSELMSGALEMCSWAEKNGFDSVMLPEHHASYAPYDPSPFVFGAAIAARTDLLQILVGAVVIPLHNPLRVAEDAAVLDNLSRGRLALCLGIGHLPSEFEMFGRELGERARLIDEGVQVLREAFTGQPFTYRGRRAQLGMRPYTEQGPKLIIGGNQPVSARRAARIGDGYFPSAGSDDLFATYQEACIEVARLPGRVIDIRGPLFWHVTEDPDRAWARLGTHLLYEMNRYGEQAREANNASTSTKKSAFSEVATVEELRTVGLHRILTPDECVIEMNSLRRLGRTITHNPLTGGLPVEEAWSSLELLTAAVIPRLDITDPSPAAAP